jgi:hypothetical protein
VGENPKCPPSPSDRHPLPSNDSLLSQLLKCVIYIHGNSMVILAGTRLPLSSVPLVEGPSHFPGSSQEKKWKLSAIEL